MPAAISRTAWTGAGGTIEPAYADSEPSGTGGAPAGPDSERVMLAQLTTALASPRVRERFAAARDLRALGVEAIGPLGTALRDRSPRVRVIAAGSLGAIADPRAVPALRQALRDSLTGRSARTHTFWLRLTGVLTVPVLVGLLWLFAALGTAPEVTFGLLLAALLTIVACTSTAWSSEHDELRCAIIDALARIGKRHGFREVRTSLPELNALHDTGWRQTRTGQTSLSSALLLISATPEDPPYPIPAEGPSPEAAPYPLPAEARLNNTAELPISAPAAKAGDED